MASMEKSIQDAIELDDIAGALVAGRDATGKFHYSKAFGGRIMPDGTKKAYEVDDLVNIFSATKLLTSIAVMQCVEKGHFALEEDVTAILPELKGLQILKGFTDDDKPILEHRKTPITLARLVTHSSGLTYDFTKPMLQKWRQLSNKPPHAGTTVKDRCLFPLIFEPGTDWSYGVGLDWAGHMVEIVTGQTLEDYFHTHIFGPVQVKDASFWPRRSETLSRKFADRSVDDPEGVGMAGTGGYAIPIEDTDCFGGGGVYMSPQDYVKVMQSLIANDGRLLQPASVEIFFKSHLDPAAHTKLNKDLADPEHNAAWGMGLPAGVNRDHAVGGMCVLEALPGWCAEGTIYWGGGYTHFWLADRKTGLCGFIAPFYHVKDTPMHRGEQKTRREGGMAFEQLTQHMKQMFQKGLYESYDAWKKVGT